MNRTLLVVLMLAPLTALLAPSAQAMDPDPLVNRILDCRTYAWDSDHDGNPEAWQTCGTPQCGCNCPVVGALIELTALGQDRTVLVVVSCQSGVGTGSEPSNNPNSAGILVTPILYPAGLQPLINTVERTVGGLVTCVPC